MVDYSRWDNIWISSDDDEDCHPNIEKYAWRRLKARMRAEKGETVQAPELRDKWSSTITNNKKEEPSLADTDPEKFLEQNKAKINKYASIKDDMKADGFLLANPKLATQLTEGYLITKAVDLAMVNEKDKAIVRIARRCLQVHNLNVSAAAAKIPAEKSVPLFFKHLKNEEKRKEYYVEFEKQLEEIKGRIETRRKERLEEEAQKAKLEEEQYEPAPLGPGGLDPNEVLESLPKDIQDAFFAQDKDMLISALDKLPNEVAQDIIKRCIDSGLWNPNPNGQAEEPVEEKPKEQVSRPEVDLNDELYDID